MGNLNPSEFWYKEAPKLPRYNRALSYSLSYGRRMMILDSVFHIKHIYSEITINPIYHSLAIL